MFKVTKSPTNHNAPAAQRALEGIIVLGSRRSALERVESEIGFARMEGEYAMLWNVREIFEAARNEVAGRSQVVLAAGYMAAISLLDLLIARHPDHERMLKRRKERLAREEAEKRGSTGDR